MLIKRRRRIKSMSVRETEIGNVRGSIRDITGLDQDPIPDHPVPTPKKEDTKTKGVTVTERDATGNAAVTHIESATGSVTAVTRRDGVAPATASTTGTAPQSTVVAEIKTETKTEIEKEREKEKEKEASTRMAGGKALGDKAEMSVGSTLVVEASRSMSMGRGMRRKSTLHRRSMRKVSCEWLVVMGEQGTQWGASLKNASL